MTTFLISIAFIGGVVFGIIGMAVYLWVLEMKK